MINGRYQGVIGSRLKELWRLLDPSHAVKKAEAYNFAPQGKIDLPSNLVYLRNWQIENGICLESSEVDCYSAKLDTDSGCIDVTIKAGELISASKQAAVDWDEIC